MPLQRNITRVSQLSDVADYQAVAEKDQPNGYPTLDSNGHLVGPIFARIGTTTQLGTPELGELCYDTTTGEFVVGDGTTPGGKAPLGITSHNSLIVPARWSSPTDMASALRDTLVELMDKTPYGEAISATNKVVLQLPSGKYDFATGDATNHGLLVDSPYVSIMGISAAPRAVIITSQIVADYRGTIEQTADHVSYYNLTIENTGQWGDSSNMGFWARLSGTVCPAAYFPGDDLPGTVMNNVRLESPLDDPDQWYCPPTRTGIKYSGTYRQMHLTSYAFGAGGKFTGYLGQSTLGDYCGGSSTAQDSNSGTVEDCLAGDYFMQGASTAAFISRRNTFGDFGLSGKNMFRGLSEDDTGRDGCWGGGVENSDAGWGCGSTAIVRRALGRDGCLTANLGAVAGLIEDSTFGDGKFAAAIAPHTGTLRNVKLLGCADSIKRWAGRMEGGTVIEMTGTDKHAVEVEAGAKFFDTTLIATGTGKSISATSAISIPVAHCRMNNGLHANVTNTISTPCNVIDSAVTL